MGNRPTTMSPTSSRRLTKSRSTMSISLETLSQSTVPIECDVCNDILSPTGFPVTGHLSLHDICRGCVERYLHGKIMDEGVCHIICPGAECQSELLPEEILDVASNVAFARFDELLCKQMYESDPNFRYCTNTKCHTGQIIVDGDAASFFKCARCGYKTCFNCSVPWHVGFTCAQYKEGLVERQFSEPRSQAWLTANAKLCECGKWIQKISGCDHMACVCGRHWCYACGASYKDINRVGNSAHRRTCPHYA